MDERTGAGIEAVIEAVGEVIATTLEGGAEIRPRLMRYMRRRIDEALAAHAAAPWRRPLERMVKEEAAYIALCAIAAAPIGRDAPAFSVIGPTLDLVGRARAAAAVAWKGALGEEAPAARGGVSA